MITFGLGLGLEVLASFTITDLYVSRV